MLLFVSPLLPANHIINMTATIESIGLHPLVINIIRSPNCPDQVLAVGMLLLSKICTSGTVSLLTDSGVCLAGLLCSFDYKRDLQVRIAGWQLGRSVVARSNSVQKEIVYGIVNIDLEPKSYSSYVGRHLLNALLSNEYDSIWFASTLLGRCLEEPQAKDLLLTLKLPTHDENENPDGIPLFSVLCSRLVLVKEQRLPIMLLLASWSHGSPSVIAQLLSNSSQTEYNCLAVFLEILAGSQSDNSIEERSVSSYILLLAVIQLPAVRGQLIPVLQQLGDKFMEPMKLANQKMEMFFENQGELLLESDFRKLIRDALPAAQEIMKIQLKTNDRNDDSNNSGVIEDPISEKQNESEPQTPPRSKSPAPPSAAKKAKLPKPLQKAKEAKRSKSDSPRPPTPDAAKSSDLEKLKNENRSLTSENLELNSEIRKIHTQLDEYESECRHYKDELKTLRIGLPKTVLAKH